jgi:hypothetical protein
MIRMTLCPNCKTIQKHNAVCSICKCPVQSPHINSAGRNIEKTKKHRSLGVEGPEIKLEQKYQI